MAGKLHGFRLHRTLAIDQPSHKCARYSTRPLHQAAIISRQHVQGNTTSAEQIFGAIAENGAAG